MALLHPSTFNLKRTGCIWAFCISNGWSVIEDFHCVVQSSMTFDWRATDLACIVVVLWYNLAMGILQAIIYIAIWCATTHFTKSNVAIDCIRDAKSWLYCQWCITFKEQLCLATVYVTCTLFEHFLKFYFTIMCGWRESLSHAYSWASDNIVLFMFHEPLVPVPFLTCRVSYKSMPALTPPISSPIHLFKLQPIQTYFCSGCNMYRKYSPSDSI